MNMMCLKIAIFSVETIHTINLGGLSVHVSELSSALAKYGHNVHVFTKDNNNGPSEFVVDNVTYHKCSYPKGNDTHEAYHFCVQAMNTFYACEQKNKFCFDIIHAHDWSSFHVINMLKAHPAKKIVTAHSTEYGRCGNKMHDGQSKVIRDVECSGFHDADMSIFVSNGLAHEVSNIYNFKNNSKMRVIYNGVDLQKYDFDPNINVRALCNIPHDANIVLFVGRLTKQKGVDMLLDSVHDVVREHPNTYFVIVGDGFLRGELEHKAHKNNVMKNVRFTGKLNNFSPLLKGLFKECTCLCVPSTNEPFGIVILEAWCYKKPVVATPCSGPLEIINNKINGYIADMNSRSIGDNLRLLIRDGAKARVMGENGYNDVRGLFSWEKIAAETLDVYTGGSKYVNMHKEKMAIMPDESIDKYIEYINNPVINYTSASRDTILVDSDVRSVTLKDKNVQDTNIDRSEQNSYINSYTKTDDVDSPILSYRAVRRSNVKTPINADNAKIIEKLNKINFTLKH
ncbi:glycosyltransferase family group 1 protein [Yasminevirus sp. GU-2018]|uniref:Glycosyltransferase family group 1 protein n=1 Tax=Yasminevirus sp. GU-2018 TaxID=2420051 RepID=A0A5K0U7A5_9VIRU|nr:glycosyltransferase family group 1 protein [Yasminevirus sp. GU-2018]